FSFPPRYQEICGPRWAAGSAGRIWLVVCQGVSQSRRFAASSQNSWRAASDAAAAVGATSVVIAKFPWVGCGRLWDFGRCCWWLLGPALDGPAFSHGEQGIGDLAEDSQQDDGHDQAIQAAIVLRIGEQEAQAHGGAEKFGGHEEEPRL